MERRYARPQVATVPLERGWNPALLLMALTLGLFVGLGLGLKDQIFRGGLDRDELYLVLASNLYGQDPAPAVAASLRQRLLSVGFANPSLTVLRLSDRFAVSRDRQRQRESEGLKILGAALNVTVEPTAVARPAATAAPPAAAGPAAPAIATATVAPPAATPPRQPSPVATSQPAAPAAPAPATAAPAASPPPQAPQGSPGTIRSADKQPVVLRKEPSTQSARIALVPFGASVQVVQVVTGKADDPGIDPKELRWYQVRWGSYSGYIYYKLVVVGE